MKNLIILLSVLLVLGTFSLVISEENSVSGTASDETIVESVGELSATDISDSESVEVIEEYEAILPTEGVSENIKIPYLKNVTSAHGWVVKSDNTNAQFLSGMWATGISYSFSLDSLVRIRNKYPEDPAKIHEELKKLDKTGKINQFSVGRLNIGSSPNIERFKLIKKEITDTRAVFYVTPISSSLKDFNQTDLETKSVGVLDLTKNSYPSINLWTGKLILNSGDYSGEWSVSMASKTKVFIKKILDARKKLDERLKGVKADIKKNAQDKKMDKAPGLEAGSEIRDALETQEKAKSKGFLRGLMFWKKRV